MNAVIEFPVAPGMIGVALFVVKGNPGVLALIAQAAEPSQIGVPSARSGFAAGDYPIDLVRFNAATPSTCVVHSRGAA